MPLVENESGHPQVLVNINGTTATFTVDTGFTGSVISKTLAQRLGVKAYRIPWRTTNGKYPLSIAPVKSLKIGQTEVLDLMVQVEPLLPMAGDGIVGGSILKQMICSFDFPNREFHIRSALPTNKGLRVGLAFEKAIPFMTAKARGRPIKLMVDTGDNGPITVQPDEFERIAADTGYPVEKDGSPPVDFSGNADSNGRRTMQGAISVAIEGENGTMTGTLSGVAEGSPNRMGLVLLQQYCLTIDPFQKKAYFWKEGMKSEDDSNIENTDAAQQ